MTLVRQASVPSSIRSLDFPSGDVGRVLRDLERFVDEAVGATLAEEFAGYPFDLYETGEQVVFEMAVPGLKAEDLDITLEERTLTVRGQFPEAPDAQERRYWFRTIPRGAFSRTVTLPVPVQADAIKARVQGGLLTIELPKVAQAQARKISVQAV